MRGIGFGFGILDDDDDSIAKGEIALLLPFANIIIIKNNNKAEAVASS